MRWLRRLIFDERGIGPIMAGGLILGGSTLLGGLLGKNKQKTIDPYAPLRGKYQEYLMGRLGQQTPYKDNPAFNLDQPAIEKQAESVISGKLGQSNTLQSDIQDISNKYYAAQKTQMEDRFAKEQEAQKNMYNRLGLASSTPGMAASTDLAREQGNELGVLSADIANKGIDREMQAMALSNDIINQYLSQGQVLGQAQRGYQQWGKEMSMKDIERMINEEYQFAGLSGNLLGSNPPQTYFQPNIWSQIGQAGQQLGTSLVAGGMLGNMGSSGLSPTQIEDYIRTGRMPAGW